MLDTPGLIREPGSNVRRILPAMLALALWPAAGLATSVAPSATPNKPPRPCNTCEDLCRLVDVYQQREKGIEIWSRYAASAKTALPADITDTASIENAFGTEFEDWLKQRKQNKQLPCRLLSDTPGYEIANQAGGREAERGPTSGARSAVPSAPRLSWPGPPARRR